MKANSFQSDCISSHICVISGVYRQSFHYLEQFCASVPNINTAVSLTKLLVVLCERQRDDNSNMNTSLGTSSKRDAEENLFKLR